MRWRWIAAGVAVYVAALVVSLPATWLDAGLQRASDGRMRLAAATGTIWSGIGQLEVRDMARRQSWSRPVSWRWRPGGLLRARVAYDLSLDPEQAPTTVTMSWAQIEAKGIDLALPAAAVGLGVPALAPFGLVGELHIKAADLVLARHATLGSATVQWRGAGSVLSPVQPLGDYELRLVADGPAIRASLHTLTGPLQLDGSGTWVYGSRPAFLATARVAPPFQQQLSPFLQLFAVEQGAGTFRMQGD